MLHCNVTQESKCGALKVFDFKPKEDDHEPKFTRAGTEEETSKPLGLGGGYAT
ncbi:MAG: hypothetical protein ACJAY6_001202 [Yoonia sp.]|jgi:hypothetical protein